MILFFGCFVKIYSLGYCFSEKELVREAGTSYKTQEEEREMMESSQGSLSDEAGNAALPVAKYSSCCLCALLM